jgi:hypothetical protein
MDPFSISIANNVARESRSGMADAPIVPDKPRRRPRWFRRDRVRRDLCEAEPRDRSPKIASAPGTC